MTIVDVGYNDWYVLPYYVEFLTTNDVADEMWCWASDTIRNWGSRPGHRSAHHWCFHFRDQKTRDWFILRWS
jgi:hypothetical protein